MVLHHVRGENNGKIGSTEREEKRSEEERRDEKGSGWMNGV